jgi:hypothetical protein
MKNRQILVAELYQGLQALADAAFPKACSNCGATYQNLEEFLRGTHSTFSSSGLKKADMERNQPVVELYRTCHCGATMLEFFCDRRDDSESGVQIRAKFAQLLDILQETGLSLATVRAELTLLLRGEHSEIFNLLGLNIDFHN